MTTDRGVVAITASGHTDAPGVVEQVPSMVMVLEPRLNGGRRGETDQ